MPGPMRHLYLQQSLARVGDDVDMRPAALTMINFRIVFVQRCRAKRQRLQAILDGRQCGPFAMRLESALLRAGVRDLGHRSLTRHK